MIRDPERLDRILALLRRFWVLYPDWRLGQLVVNVSEERDPFFIEDEDLEKKLRKAVFEAERR